jgi:serine/threonine protein kinase
VKSMFASKYELAEPLATGGMASVWKAWVHDDAGERPCVIKRILAGAGAEPDAVAMFRREARLCSLLKHPNIVRVFDFGRHEGEYFLAMDFVEGRDLLDTMRGLEGRPTPLGLVAYVIRELCRALAYAHTLTDEKGAPLRLVHRDVSPSNVLIARDGSVRLLDFGVAKVVSVGTTVTSSGTVKGKLAYMSPEQLTGEAVDGRTDVFAAGVVMHELLCGRRLFRGDEDDETIAKILEQPIPKPSERRADVPPELDAICMKALERDPRQRYQRADQVADALDPIARALDWDARRAEAWLNELPASPISRVRDVEDTEPSMSVEVTAARPTPIPPGKVAIPVVVDPLARRRLRHALAFYLVLAFAGLTNSFFIADSGLYRFVFPTAIAAMGLYFAYLLKISTPLQRMIWLIGMFVCGFGENFLVYGLDLYHFSPTVRPPYAIPPYVIVGHGYALWTAFVLGEAAAERLGARRAFAALLLCGLVLVAARGAVLRDVYGATWLVFYLLVLLGTRRVEHRVFYATTFVLCTFLEIVGVTLRAWDWHAATYYLDTGRFPIANPPAAVGSIYVTGDFLTLLVIRAFKLDDGALEKEAPRS